MDQSRLATLLGIGGCIVGVVGYVAFGWRFGGSSASVSSVLGLAVAAVAVGLAALRLLDG